ncbi:MAG TPA: hypothetical protein VNB06_21595 [Thermoanaerobaculia bacterium]|nr:hypothetical protein [Thermoanaerobaculia bacterium]
MSPSVRESRERGSGRPPVGSPDVTRANAPPAGSRLRGRWNPGDLFYGGAPYLGDGYPQDYVATLEALKALDVDVLVGGHGPPVRGRAVLDQAQQYIRTYWDQVTGFHARGLSLDEALQQLDLSGFERWALFQLGNPEVLRLEVSRMYHVLDGGS